MGLNSGHQAYELSECFDLLRYLPGLGAIFLMFPHMYYPSVWREDGRSGGGREGGGGEGRKGGEENGRREEGTDSTRLDLLVCLPPVNTLAHGLVFNPKSLFVLFNPKIPP